MVGEVLMDRSAHLPLGPRPAVSGKTQAEPAELRERSRRARSRSLSSTTSEEVCLFTLEPISSYPPEDVFTTLEGKRYYLPTLKVWLQKNDTLPHNNLPAPQEIARLWPGHDKIIAPKPRFFIQNATNREIALLARGVAMIGIYAGLLYRMHQDDSLSVPFLLKTVMTALCWVQGVALFTLVSSIQERGAEELLKSLRRPVSAEEFRKAGVIE
jgi:hypothetical protein